MIRLILLLAALAATGCSRYAAPALAVTQARVTDMTDHGVVVAFDIDARNTNEVELPLREMHYTLSLDGREVFSGLRSPEATLSRLSTQRITVPAVIPIAPGEPRPSGAVPYTLRGRLAYTVPGQISQVLFDINVRRPEAPFSQTGTIDLGAVMTPAATPAPVAPPATPPAS